MEKKLKWQKGFTLIELLVVIGILAVLLAITLIAINPARQFSQANDTKRSSDVNAILNAVNQYMADNKGVPPSGITSTVAEISNTGADLCNALVPKYIAALPVDPQTSYATGVAKGTAVTKDGSGNCPAAYVTNYFIVKSATDSRITVYANGTEVAVPTISVNR